MYLGLAARIREDEEVIRRAMEGSLLRSGVLAGSIVLLCAVVVIALGLAN